MYGDNVNDTEIISDKPDYCIRTDSVQEDEDDDEELYGAFALKHHYITSTSACCI